MEIRIPKDGPLYLALYFLLSLIFSGNETEKKVLAIKQIQGPSNSKPLTIHQIG